jgi:diguanylate cyclase (GGDEF)-like protein
MPPELIIVDGKVVAVRLAGHEFIYDSESHETSIPKKMLTGLCLSEIPPDVILKPVESISGTYVEVNDNIGLSFANGSASAVVEFTQRRKLWDHEVELSSYMKAFRQAIREREDAEELDFQDDGEYILLSYAMKISEDLEILDAIKHVEGIIGGIEERAEQLAHRKLDPLLGILNRRSFDVDSAYALRQSKAGVVLILAKIDHLEKVNDEYGHQQGDAVVKAVAHVLDAESARISCKAYSYGREELAAILTNVDGKGVSDFAKLVRWEVEKLTFSNVPHLRVTISLGVALAPRDGSNPEELWKKADSELYVAKHDRLSRAKSAN